MRKNLRKVMNAFVGGKSAQGDFKKTCSTDGTTIYSYDMPIARRVFGGVEVINRKNAPSRTTASQISALITWLPGCLPPDEEFIVVDQLSGTQPHVFKKVYR